MVNRSVLWVTGGFLALHLGLAALVPLISDEGYYALWSSALDWDYYDHPPMIAAMIRIGSEVFGLNPFGIRVVSMLAMAVTSVLVARIAGLMAADEAADQAAARAALYFNLGFLALGVGGFATPDVPSTLFWALATWATLKAVAAGGARRWDLGWWALAGLACGFGVLSKFTNLFLMVGFFGWLIATRSGRETLRKPGPWVAVLSAGLVVTPLILWNISHHGLGFERQFSRIAATGITLDTFVQYLVILVLVPTPLIGLFALRGAAGWRGRALLLWSVAPLLAYFAVHSLHGAVEVNWPMPATVAMAVLAALAAPQFGRGWQRAALISGAVLSFGVMGILFNPWRPINAVDTPANQIRGWETTLPVLKAAARGTAWIATRDYGLTGRLWVALPDMAVFSVTEPQRWGFRGGFPLAFCDLPGLLVENATDDPALAAQEFGTVGPASEVERSSAGVTIRKYRLRVVSHVKDKGLCP